MSDLVKPFPTEEGSCTGTTSANDVRITLCIITHIGQGTTTSGTTTPMASHTITTGESPNPTTLRSSAITSATITSGSSLPPPARPAPSATPTGPSTPSSQVSEATSVQQTNNNVTFSVTQTTQVTVSDTAKTTLVIRSSATAATTSPIASTTSTTLSRAGTTLNNGILAVVVAVPSVSIISAIVITIFCIRKRAKRRKAGIFPPVEGAIQPFLVSSNGAAPPPYCKVDVARRLWRERANVTAAVITNDEKTGS